MKEDVGERVRERKKKRDMKIMADWKRSDKACECKRLVKEEDKKVLMFKMFKFLVQIV